MANGGDVAVGVPLTFYNVSKQIPKGVKRHCGMCRQHGVVAQTRNHACPFKDCDCKKCNLVRQRRSIMSLQIRLRREQDKKFVRTAEPEQAEIVPPREVYNLAAACYFCQKCKNHGILQWKKDHKKICNFTNCRCEQCDLIDTRRALDSHIKKGRKAIARPPSVKTGRSSTATPASSSSSSGCHFSSPSSLAYPILPSASIVPNELVASLPTISPTPSGHGLTLAERLLSATVSSPTLLETNKALFISPSPPLLSMGAGTVPTVAAVSPPTAPQTPSGTPFSALFTSSPTFAFDSSPYLLPKDQQQQQFLFNPTPTSTVPHSGSYSITDLLLQQIALQSLLAQQQQAQQAAVPQPQLLTFTVPYPAATVPTSLPMPQPQYYCMPSAATLIQGQQVASPPNPTVSLMSELDIHNLISNVQNMDRLMLR